MKKICFILAMAFLLSGCSLQTFEQVEDPNDVQAMATPASLSIDLPESAAACAMQNSTGSLYFCGDYDIAVEVLHSGNLDQTIRSLTGFGREELDVIQTVRKGAVCYEGAWSAAGESGDHVGRFLVLDDGSFHYCVSIIALAASAASCTLEWNAVLSSVALSAK